MKMKFAMPFSLLLVLACSIKTPEITLTGEKTAMENQILGSFEQLSDQALNTTSRRTSGVRETETVSEHKQAVFDAVQNQKLNRIEIQELKRDKIIGENNEGYLEILPTERYKNDPQYQKRVDFIVAQENRDREVIYQQVVVLNYDAAEIDTAELNRIFTNVQFEASEAGTMIQQPDGRWIPKPEQE